MEKEKSLTKAMLVLRFGVLKITFKPFLLYSHPHFPVLSLYLFLFCSLSHTLAFFLRVASLLRIYFYIRAVVEEIAATDDGFFSTSCPSSFYAVRAFIIYNPSQTAYCWQSISVGFLVGCRGNCMEYGCLNGRDEKKQFPDFRLPLIKTLRQRICVGGIIICMHDLKLVWLIRAYREMRTNDWN